MSRRPALLLCLALAAPATGLGATAPAPARAASIADAPVRTVKAGQGRIAYRSVGKGSPIVLVMGLSGTMDAWAPSFADGLAATGHRVITFDNEGVGRTTKGKGVLTIDRMGDDTASLIRALRLRRADVLGWSMGGMIAQAAAIQHPKQVRRLVLAATAPGDGKERAPAGNVLSMLSGGSGVAESASGLLALVFPADQQAAQAEYVRQILRYPHARLAAPAAVTQAQLVACGGWLIGRDPASASPRRIKQRVLVGAGAQDPLLPVANDQHIADTAPHATLKVYADASHGFLFQHQDDFVGAVARFLR